MTGRATFLPMIMVIVILLLLFIAIATARTGGPAIAADKTYPHYICTFTSYCAGSDCNRDENPFVIYLEHDNGLPRIELNGFAPTASVRDVEGGIRVEATGGAVTGVFSIYDDRALDFRGESGGTANPTEHFATGVCEPMHRP